MVAAALVGGLVARLARLAWWLRLWLRVVRVFSRCGGGGGGGGGSSGGVAMVRDRQCCFWLHVGAALLACPAADIGVFRHHNHTVLSCLPSAKSEAPTVSLPPLPALNCLLRAVSGCR
eukprot:SAG31_NODE_5872_length_2280_cov_84.549289_3_plen_118_part_00